METNKQVQLNLSIPEYHRNLLRRMAAERMLSDPSEVVSGASIASEILINALRKLAGETKKEGENKQ